MGPLDDDPDLLKARLRLAELLADPRIDKPLMNNPKLLKIADKISTEIAELEDYIEYLLKMAALEKANQARWADKA